MSISTPYSIPAQQSTPWSAQAINSTGFQPQNLQAIPGFILQEDGISKILFEDKVSKLQQE